MIVGVPTETFPGERRVATIPAVVPALTKAGLDVLLEPGAGVSAGFLDAPYTNKGARVAGDRAQLFADADVILQVRALGANTVAGRADLELFRPGQIVIGFSEPLDEPQAARNLAAQGVTEAWEIGAGKALSGMIRRIDKSVATRSIGTPDEVKGASDA